jgi:hypothetical protein
LGPGRVGLHVLPGPVRVKEAWAGREGRRTGPQAPPFSVVTETK